MLFHNKLIWKWSYLVNKKTFSNQIWNLQVIIMWGSAVNDHDNFSGGDNYQLLIIDYFSLLVVKYSKNSINKMWHIIEGNGCWKGLLSDWIINQ